MNLGIALFVVAISLYVTSFAVSFIKGGQRYIGFRIALFSFSFLLNAIISGVISLFSEKTAYCVAFFFMITGVFSAYKQQKEFGVNAVYYRNISKKNERNGRKYKGSNTSEENRGEKLNLGIGIFEMIKWPFMMLAEFDFLQQKRSREQRR